MAPPSPSRKRQRIEIEDQQDNEYSQDASERSCDACKRRRVKCDRTFPCANCRRRQEDCRTTNATGPSSGPRSTFTKEHDRKIDAMASRLATIEQLLRDQQEILASFGRGGIPATESASHSNTMSVRSMTALPSPESQPAHDGTDATAETHSTAAHKLVENAILDSSSVHQDTELIAAVQSLKEMANKMADGPEPPSLNSPWRPLHLSNGPVDPPTSQELERMLVEVEDSITIGFTPGLTADELRQKCRTVFESNAQAEPIRRMYVYGTLRNLAVEFGGQHEDAEFARRCKVLSAHFSIQLGYAVDDLKFVVPATPEAASAMTIASGAAMELCRPIIAQSLGAKAASIVLALGYNRLSSMRSDADRERQVKIFTFWMAYWLDTSFSVRLGRAPIIRPQDIAVPKLTEDSIIPQGWSVAFNYSTRISGLQCKVVEQLYTPLAVETTLEERKKRASKLVQELDSAWQERGPGPTSVALWKDSDAVMHWSTVCLVQHATMSSANDESPALGTARHALRLNIEAWDTHKDLPDFIWAGHCHWTLLKGPITPFVVTFCHIIAHPLSAQDDMHLLEQFVGVLGSLRHFSDGMIKLHKLCDVLAKVATLYVQAKSRESASELGSHDNRIAGAVADDDPSSAWYGQPAVDDINEYLSSIGLAPPAMPAHETVAGFDQMPDFDPSFLADWYQGNNSLMGLLEQDLAFDLNP